MLGFVAANAADEATHATSKAVVRLVSSHPNIILRIEDNGSGFNLDDRLVKAVNEKRMGLRSMEERINLLQGTMSIQSRSMKGTKILIEVPIHDKGNREENRHSDY